MSTERITLQPIAESRQAVQRHQIKSNMLAAHHPEQVYERIHTAAANGLTEISVSYVPNPRDESEFAMRMHLGRAGYTYTARQESTHVQYWISWRETE